MALTQQDVQRLIGLLDASQFDEMRLEMDGLKLELRRNGAAPLGDVSAPRAAAPAVQPAAPAAPDASTSAVAPRAASPASGAPVTPSGSDASKPQPGLDIRAPMLGTFYCAPKPGAAPFVAVGAQVAPDTVVAVIEVMKLMNSVTAGVSGEVAEILVRDGDLVEFDQPMIRLRAA